MNAAELKETLELHNKWLHSKNGGARANLSGAYLSGADLSRADLSGANLSGADLSRADLSGANLSGANLSGAYLSGADLSGADLSGADLSGAKGVDPFRWLICPQAGPFWAYKKLRSGVVRVEVPADAGRVNASGSRKVRVSKFMVAELVSGTADNLKPLRDDPLVYEIGKECVPDSFDPSPYVECSNGLHVFMTKEEAEEFSL